MNPNIEDFFVEEDKIIQSAIQKKEEQIHQELKKEKYFLTRYTTIQDYFLHLSWISKRKFMIQLLEQLRSLPSILQILHVMASRSFKCISYDYVDPNSEFVADKLMLDHDRMLDKAVLEKQVEDDVEWFTTLSDAFQVTVIIGLLRLSAGVAKRNMYFPIWRRYYELVREMMLVIGSHTTSVTATGDFVCYTSFAQDNEGVEFDLRHPSSIEVEKERKIWDDMIERYKSDVHEAMKQLQSLSAGKTKKRSTDNAEKTGKKNKKKEKKGRRRNSKTAKAVQVPDKIEMDAIQLIPIWIVKKIFSFLDAKSLQTCKKVNKYWSYVVTEMAKEDKARKQLDKQLETIKAIGEQKIEEIKNHMRANIPRSRKRNTNIMHYSFGAIAEKLVPKTNIHLEGTSLVEKAVKQMPDLYGETKCLSTFPRLIKSDMEMYRYKSCFLKDVNVQYEVDRDIEKQKSLLTYSLGSIIESFKITVGQSVLEDW